MRDYLGAAFGILILLAVIYAVAFPHTPTPDDGPTEVCVYTETYRGTVERCY